MKKSLACVVILAVFVCGCAGLSYTEQRMLTGGALGAAGGAVIGGAAGSAATGAAVGGGAGVIGGYLYDRYEKSRGRW
jgi:osmotically inducible lipoprotein OsmB